MDCSDIDRFIQLYLDGELDRTDMIEFELHVARCSRCKSVYQFEKSFRSVVKEKLATRHPPSHLRERVRNIIEHMHSHSKLTSHIAIAVAATLVILGGISVLGLLNLTQEISYIATEGVNQHMKQLPPEITTSDPKMISSWFNGKVDFSVRLPRFNNSKVTLLGARITNIKDKQAAHIRYELDGEKLSLFIFDNGDGTLPNNPNKEDRRKKISFVTFKGYSIASWCHRLLGYTLVSDMNQEKMARLITEIMP